MSQRLVWLLSALLCSAGCARIPPMFDVARVAGGFAEDGSCDAAESLSVDRLGGDRYAVLGCGLAGVYRCSRVGYVECTLEEPGVDAWRRAVGDWAPPPVQTAAVPTQAVPAASDAPVRARLDHLASGILECAGGDRLALRVEWGADCVLRAALREERDDRSEVEGCIDAILARSPISECGTAGRVLHVVENTRAPEPAIDP